MPVVSISLNEKLLEKLEKIENELGYSGRSEVIRTAARDFISKKQNLDGLKGDKTAILTVWHDNDANLEIHDYQGLVGSQLHDHDEEGDCMQVFVLSGDAEEILKMKNHLESKRKVKKADISLS